MLLRIKELINEKGVFGTAKHIIKKLTGRARVEEQIDTLYYFLNTYADVTKAAPAVGALRELQECDAVLLKIFHNVCQKNKLTYWIDWGTLLGAKRHGGFIPWDDDMDVAMPRADYDRALEILPDLMKEYGIAVYEFKERPMISFGFSYMHAETGIWLDVFPIDGYETDSSLPDTKNHLTRLLEEYKKFYLKKRFKLPKAEIVSQKGKIISEKRSEIKDRTYYFEGPEIPGKRFYVFNSEDIFPLGSIDFEGYSLAAPGNVEAFLTEEYGNYMTFPKSGVLHHATGNNQLFDRAKTYGVSMAEIKNKLIEIEEKTR